MLMLPWHQDAYHRIFHIRKITIDEYDRNIARFDEYHLFRSGMAMSIEPRWCIKNTRQMILNEMALCCYSHRDS